MLWPEQSSDLNPTEHRFWTCVLASPLLMREYLFRMEAIPQVGFPAKGQKKDAFLGLWTFQNHLRNPIYRCSDL